MLLYPTFIPNQNNYIMLGIKLGIKYIYIEETLRDSLINDSINNNTDGDLLKYFDKFFSYGDNLIGYSFTWSSTKNGHEFWRKMFVAWADYLRAYSAYINR